MKKLILLCIIQLFAVSIIAQELRSGQVAIKELNVARNEEKLFVSMNFGLEDLNLKSNYEILLTPALIAVGDTLNMPAVVVAGRNRYYHYLRNEKELNGRVLYRADKVDNLPYQASVAYEKWMETAELVLRQDSCGCQNLLMKNEDLLAVLDYKPRVFEPDFVYIRPEAVVEKVLEIEGKAYIDFPVSRTEIYPEYRKNPVELKKIIATIDTVKNDPDARIVAVTIKGYASPESPYSNNTRLAKGRTETLKNYLQGLYHFSEGIIQTDYEPEDWEGLRKYVESSDLEHKQEILALIDSDREPDNKEWKIKKTYPAEYAFLLKEVYPGLRHSDYAVKYTVRAYTSVEEAKKVLATNPRNLSLDEFYMIANSYQQGSDEYNEVIATAVLFFSNDPIANLNAANMSMQRKDFVSANKYLQKAGDSAEAQYARGVYAGLQGDYKAAREFLMQAHSMPQAVDALSQLDEIERKKK